MTSYRNKIKRDKTDDLLSKLIRERVNWVCEYCGKDFSHNKGGLHHSHLYGRRSKGTRWHPQNGFAHCHDCHRHLGENPPEFARWAEGRLGKQTFEMLRLLANKPTKFSKFDKEILHKNYLKERKRLRELRAQGDTGRLEFFLP